MSEKLDVSRLLEKYKEWVDKEKINFLKKSSDRENISKQVEELKNKHFSDGGRKNRGEEDWYQLHEDGTTLWRDLASCALNDIDENSKGNSKLFEFLKAATEFEDLLYGLEPYYRDHTLHSLWVYLIGEYIIRELIPKNHKGMNWYLYNDIDHDQKKYDYPKELVKEAEEQEKKFVGRVAKHKDAIWCIIALCHDLGYSLEKLKNLNEKVQAVLKFYDVPDFKHVGYSLDIEHQYILSQFLELMAMDVRIVPSEDWEIEDLKEKLNNGDLTPDQYKKKLEQKVLIKCYRDDSTYWRLCRALEKRQHGILSAYLIYKILDIFSDTSVRGPAEEWGLDDNEVAYNIIRGDVLFAIAQHQFDFAHLNQLSSLADVLMLADELEEFSRYGRQLTSRRYYPTTANAELSIKNKDEKEGKKEYLGLVISYESKHTKRIDFLEFFWRKAKRLCETYSLDLRKQEKEEKEEEEESKKTEIFRHEDRYYYIKNIKMNVKYGDEEYYFYIDKNSDISEAKLPETLIDGVECKATTYPIRCWDDNVIVHNIEELKDQKGTTLRDWIDGVKKLEDQKAKTPKEGS